VTPEQAAAAARPAVVLLGGAFIECPRTLRRARQLGLTGWAFYIAGRGGALGDVRPDVVAAALGFVAPDAVREAWEAARQVLAPGRVAAATLAECCRWGIEHLGPLPGVARLADLAHQVVAAADPAGMPLFAAWRAMPISTDAPGARAAVALHLLREFRSGAQLLAIRAAGLTPLEATLAGPDGESAAVAFGWQPPYPPLAPLLRRWVWAEAVADKITGAAYGTLPPAQRKELIGLLDSGLATVGSGTPAAD
jgi:hypothetical protein